MALRIVVILYMLLGAFLSPSLAADKRSGPTIPEFLSPEEEVRYERAFSALKDGDIERAEAEVKYLRNDLLLGSLQGEILLARENPDMQSVLDWLHRFPDLPQAKTLVSWADAQGTAAINLPELPAQSTPDIILPPQQQPLETNRDHARFNTPGINKALKADNFETAEKLWNRVNKKQILLKTVTGGRVAWHAYLAGDDERAIRVGVKAGSPPVRQAALGLWAAGLASWRMGQYHNAYQHFVAVLSKPKLDKKMEAAAGFWAARSAFVAKMPENVSGLLSIPARQPESYYGLLSLRWLGLAPRLDLKKPKVDAADWEQILNIAGVKRAVTFARMGFPALADQEFQTLWHRLDVAQFDAVYALVSRLGLPRTEAWIADQKRIGSDRLLSKRLPNPNWTPYGGWSISPHLIFAIVYQESRFFRARRSYAGARGVMQIMPQTVSEIVKSRHFKSKRRYSLNNPLYNLALGQAYLKILSDRYRGYTEGKLVKVIASYNAGPGHLKRWSATKGAEDSLLFIESIPFRETRHYVKNVLCYYWRYQLQEKNGTPDLGVLVAGRWAQLPGVSRNDIQKRSIKPKPGKGKKNSSPHKDKKR